jgi:DNA helicase HerA-like ATPase
MIRLVKEGRNIGLSFALTTQQPNAIDSRVMSQVETFLIHQLTSRQDIDNVRNNLKSAEPESIKIGTTEIDLATLIRSLQLGQAVVSNANTTRDVSRSFVTNIRPRISVHGGFED